MENLFIDVKKQTSILEIAFRIKIKLTNLVLDQIIEAYQEYSGKGKEEI